MRPDHAIVRSADVVNTNMWRNWPVICVDKIADIPKNYPGLMGVPITFLDKFNSEQFEIVDISNHYKLVNGREPYKRIFVRNLCPNLPETIDLIEEFDRMGVPIDFEFVKILPDDAMIIHRNSGDEGGRGNG